MQEMVHIKTKLNYYYEKKKKKKSIYARRPKETNCVGRRVGNKILYAQIEMQSSSRLADKQTEACAHARGCQEGQLSVSGERMCTILVNRLED